MGRTSSAKAKSNRRNALRSTGPRTPEGKAKSSRNALRHGLLSREAVLQTESLQDFKRLRETLGDELAPVGELEELLVDRIAGAAWRLRRVIKAEGETLEEKSTDYMGEEKGVGHAFSTYGNVDHFSKLSKYETTIERGLYKALHELQRLQAARNGEGAPLPVAADIDLTTGG